MALTRKQSQSNTIIIVGLIVVILAGLGYFVVTRFILKDGSDTGNINGLRNPRGLVNFDASILSDPRVTGLKDYRVGVNANTAVGQPAPFR